MCIAIVKPASSSITRKRLETCFDSNPDGAGFAIRLDDGIYIHKGYFDFDDFMAAYKQYEVDNHDALIHFRITTRGDDSSYNCHPFAMAESVMIHNGTINALGKANEGPSDSQLLAQYLNDVDINTLQTLAPLLEQLIGYSRVAFMHTSGKTVVLNKNDWHEADGVLYSNNGYKERVAYSYSRSWNTSKSMETVSSTQDAIGNVALTPEYTLEEYGFIWDDMKLYRQENGVLVEDTELEDDVLTAWFTEPPYHTYYPEGELDMAELNELTIDFVELEWYNHDSFGKANKAALAALND